VDSSNNVYVTDSGNSRIEKFDSSGNYLTQWGSSGSGNGQFSGPSGVAVDSSGNYIYVTDYSNSRIQVFANNTNIIPPFITQQPPNQTIPAGITVTFCVSVVGAAPFAYQWTSNNVVVPGATNAILMLTNVSLSASGNTYSVLVTNVFGSGLSSSAVLTVLPAAEFLTPMYLFQIDASAVPGGSGFSPSFVALDRNNNVYVTDDNGNRIVKFTAGGTYLTQWGSFGSGNSQFSYPYGITLDSSNNVYVADFGNNRVEKFDSSGNYLTQWGSFGSGNGQFEDPLGIAADSQGNVFVSDFYNSRIEKFDSLGNYLTQWGSPGSGNGQFLRPQGVAVDSSNNVYVVDNNNNRVEKFDNLGNYVMQWGGFGSGNGQFSGPLGITVDSGNNVYVADSGNSRIEKFDSNGNYLARWGGSGGGNGQFSGPNGVAVDSSGNYIYVTDYNNQRIQVFVNTLPPPQLTIIPSGAYVFLTWPTNDTGFTLQSTFNLGASAVWNANSQAPVVIGGQNVVINPITGTRQFYRLQGN
jgi:DNA-binding beta-propeller fold protein YncE